MALSNTATLAPPLDNPTETEVYHFIVEQRDLTGRSPSQLAMMRHFNVREETIITRVSRLIGAGKLKRVGEKGKQQLIPVLTLDDHALEYLAREPNAVLVWLQSRHGTGFAGFEVWTPEAGHIVTVLEV